MTNTTTEKKDANGTIIGTTKKAPHGYGACTACGHKNVHLNADRSLKAHGSTATMAMCTGGAGADECSICRRVHGREIQHACE